MPKARKPTDPKAPKKAARTKKPVGAATEPIEMPQAHGGNKMSVDEQVRKRAYQIYQERGGTGGTAEEDWLQAETEILGKRSA